MHTFHINNAKIPWCDVEYITSPSVLTASYLYLSAETASWNSTQYTLLHLNGRAHTPTRVNLDTHNASSSFGTSIRARRNHGTVENPGALLKNDVLLQLVGDGWNGESVVSNTVAVNFFAADNWTTSSTPTYIAFHTSPANVSGGTPSLEVGRFTPEGNFVVSQSIYALTGFFGSLSGTASHAMYSLSASYAPGSPSVSASYAVTSSYNLSNGLNVSNYDFSYIEYNGPNGQFSTCTYRVGGASGSIVCIITANYDGNTFTGVSKSFG
jgi:hypothetical protein